MLKTVVIDIEATCWRPGDERRNRQSELSEIIELYALVFTQTKSTHPFHMFTRPVVHPQLSSFCEELTGISQLQIDQAPSGEVFIARWEEWLMKYQPVDSMINVELASWGIFDQVLMKRTWLRYREASPPWIHIDIKRLFENFCRAHRTEMTVWFDQSSLSRISGLSLKEAVLSIKSDFKGPLHNARSDTIAAAECLSFVLDEAQVTPKERSLLSLVDHERSSGESQGISDRPAYWGEAARAFVPNKQAFQKVASRLIEIRLIQRDQKTGGLRRVDQSS